MFNCLYCKKEMVNINSKFCSHLCSSTYNNSRNKERSQWLDDVRIKNSMGVDICSICQSKLKKIELHIDLKICSNCIFKTDETKFTGGSVIKNIYIRDILYSCKSITDTCEKLNIEASVSNRRKIGLFIRTNNIDVKHFSDHTNRKCVTRINIKDLCEYSERDYGSVKKFIIRNNLVEHTKCSICGMGTEWNSMKLVLQMDHINGVNNDHRLENLRFVCPNCHSQTSTYGNKRGKTKTLLIKQKCKICDFNVKIGFDLCSRCYNKQNEIYHNTKLRKFEITKEELINLVNQYPMTKIGELFGVSDNAVKKRCKLLHIEIPEKRRGNYKGSRKIS